MKYFRKAYGSADCDFCGRSVRLIRSGGLLFSGCLAAFLGARGSRFRGLVLWRPGIKRCYSLPWPTLALVLDWARSCLAVASSRSLDIACTMLWKMGPARVQPGKVRQIMTGREEFGEGLTTSKY